MHILQFLESPELSPNPPPFSDFFGFWRGGGFGESFFKQFIYSTFQKLSSFEALLCFFWGGRYCQIFSRKRPEFQRKLHMKTSFKGHYWGCFWTSNRDISGSNRDMDMVESALESWDFILYDDKNFGYHRIFYGTQKMQRVPQVKMVNLTKNQ